ncbi:ATP-binding protein [Azospirillum sp. YIM DDC1]|uniref:ATP-binding protein n=1 Tax=Azospirillum aestuarii TaxID=2802052 RepID=A0ABS1IA61_9PROT|nr:ATP-binding protein [Azospirillum aestuarii]MBK4723593.1 ATP-binding protein [Azospirillum aestuarii]
MARITRDSPRYVRTKHFYMARAQLADCGAVLISGPPGVGKTTLANMLMLDSVAEGFEPVAIRREVRDGIARFRPRTRQVFWYDDFLGATFIGDRSPFAERNEDGDLVDFIEAVRDAGSRFLLTTREHILQDALMSSGRLAYSGVPNLYYRMALEDLEDEQRARILYNHLYFGSLPQEHVVALVTAPAKLVGAVKHRNFSPRVVEWVTDFKRLKGVSPKDYPDHLEAAFDDPAACWEDTYRNQVSESARCLLLALYSLGGEARVTDLRRVWEPLQELRRSPSERREGAFDEALRSLDNSLTTVHQGTVTFLNPSIKEFIGGKLSGAIDNARDLLLTARLVAQLTQIWALAEAKRSSPLRTYIHGDGAPVLVEALARTLLHPYRLPGARGRSPVDIGPEARAAFVAKVLVALGSQGNISLLQQAIGQMLEVWSDGWRPNIPNAVELLYVLFDGRPHFDGSWDNLFQSVKIGVLGALFRSVRASDFLEIRTLATKLPERWAFDDHERYTQAFKRYIASAFPLEVIRCRSCREVMSLTAVLGGASIGTGFEWQSTFSMLEGAIRRLPEVGETAELKVDAAAAGNGMSDAMVAALFTTLLQHEGAPAPV